MRRDHWVGVAVAALVLWSGSAHAQGFVGDYDPVNWTATPMTGGTVVAVSGKGCSCGGTGTAPGGAAVGLPLLLAGPRRC